MMSSLELKNIYKSFLNKNVLADVNLTFQPEMIYGLFGCNGAGKSTLLNIIASRILTDGGEVFYDHQSVWEYDDLMAKIYLVDSNDMYYPGMKLSKIIADTAGFYGEFDQEYALELSEKFELNLDQKYAKLSTGYKTIFKLIMSLCVPAEYVLLDEPVLGLDSQHRKLFYQELLNTYTKKPRTFIIATHLIDEISQIIQRVLIMQNGKIVVNQEVEELLAEAYLVLGSEEDLAPYIHDLHVIGHEKLGNLHGYYILGELPAELTQQTTVQIETLSLDQVFVHLIQDEEGDAYVNN